MGKIQSICSKSVWLIFLIIIGVTCILNIFYRDSINYNLKLEIIMKPYTCGCLAAIVLVITVGVCRCILKRISYSSCDSIDRDILMILILSVLIFIAQIYVFYRIYFITDWDVETLVGAAQAINYKVKTGGYREWHNWDWFRHYFSTYQNNLALLFVYTKIIGLHDFLGILEPENGYMLIIIVDCFLADITAILIFFLARRFTANRACPWIAYVAYFILVLSSPWLTIPYSDFFVPIFPILIILCYDNIVHGKYIPISIVGLFIAFSIGTVIKAQILILGIAIFIVELIKFSKECFLNFVIIVCVLALSILASALYVQLICNWAGSVGIEINDEKAFGWQHFFLIGTNEETSGVWAGDDVAFSESFSNVEERNQADLTTAFRRIEDMCAGKEDRLITHFLKKWLTTTADGTFGFARAGVFYAKESEAKDSYAVFFRNCLLSYGTYYHQITLIRQILWLAVWLANMLIVFSKNKRFDNTIIVLELAVIGIVCFELCFECSARHMFSYISIIILLAVIGIESAAEGWLKKREFH